MKDLTINRDKTKPAKRAVASLTPQPDLFLNRRLHTVTLNVGGSRYEMTWHTEIREITKGPASVIEMPPPSARKR
jgi:hypothetical protein